MFFKTKEYQQALNQLVNVEAEMVKFRTWVMKKKLYEAYHIMMAILGQR